MSTDAIGHDRIAGNSSINSGILSCFRFITPDDEQKFRRKFREHYRDRAQVLHTYRELVVGGYLGSHGFSVKYEPVVEGQTPDWAILDENLNTYRGIVEVINFHADRSTETFIDKEIESRGAATTFLPDNDNRLYDRLQQKTACYKPLIEKQRIPYIIALFGEFYADVELEEVTRCTSECEDALFNRYPMLTGVLFFVEKSGVYSFSYLANGNASYRLHVSNGVFPPGENRATGTL